MFDQLSATCTVRMRSTCRHFSIFPRMFWSLISHFSLRFPFLCNLSLFSFYFRVCFSFKLPFSVLHSLVSSLCSCFFFYSSIIDYSSIKVDCLSIVFLFALLGCLLEAVEGECLKWVNLFVGRGGGTVHIILTFLLNSLWFPILLG